MSGQQEQWNELDRFDQLDPRDATLDLSGLISRQNNGVQHNGAQNNGSLSNGKSSVAGNGVNGIGDTVPYARPPQRTPAESGDVPAPPRPSSPPVSAVRGAHAAVTVSPPPSGANGHGAIAAYSTYATQGAQVTPRPTPETVAAEPGPDLAAGLEPESQPLPELGAPPGTAMSAVRPERPVPGSLADLRQRLERLPYGHPSSPYHVDGERKPPPYRLKHLELAPPTPSRITQAHSHPPVAEDHPIAAATTPSAPAAVTANGEEAESARNSAPAILTQDQMRIADDAYDRFRAAEGRNLFGSYGSTGLTTELRAVAASLEYGELAPDAEQNALLEPEAFRARFAAMLAHYPDRTAELLARRIPGAISYSIIFDAERYSAGIWMAQDALTAKGFQLLARRNDWHNPVNRCVATMWHDPASGLPFEVQFHTAASLEAQQLAHSSPQSDLAGAWAALPAPPGHSEISDYRKHGGQPPAGAAPG